jgi:hypothetical protein
MVQISGDGPFAQVAPLRRELVVEGDITNLNVELVDAGLLRGVVSVEGGTALPEGLRVRLLPTEPNQADADETVATTFVNSKGVFSLSPITSGTFHLSLTGLAGGHYVKSITLKGKDLLRNPIRIETGYSFDGINVVLSTELVSLTGRVVEKTDRNKALVNGMVMLFPVELERRRISDGPIVAFSDKDGRFVVKAAPGEYFVFVVDRRRKDVPVVMPAEASLVKDASTLQKINLQRADEKRVVEIVGP